MTDFTKRLNELTFEFVDEAMKTYYPKNTYQQGIDLGARMMLKHLIKQGIVTDDNIKLL